MTSLAYIFTMEKALVKIIFGHKMFICQPIFKVFVAVFTTFGMQNLLLGVFQNKVICKKADSK